MKRSWKSRASVLLVLTMTLIATPMIRAESRIGGLLRGTLIATAVQEIAGPLNDFINTIVARRGLASQEMTRVVPILSVGDKTYVGAAQVSGPSWRVNTVRACLQIQGEFSGGQHRVALFIPSSSDNPLEIRRVPEVGVTALIDSTLWGTKVGPKGGRTNSDVIRAAAIAWVVSAVGEEIDRGIRGLARLDAPSKVVPNLSVGEKSYIGLAQIVGTPGSLDRVEGVVSYEDSFSGKYRIRITLPVEHLGDVRFRRVDGAGINAFIMTTVRKDAHEMAPPPPPPAPPRSDTVVFSPPPPPHDGVIILNAPPRPDYGDEEAWRGGRGRAGKGPAWKREGGHPGRGRGVKRAATSQERLWADTFYRDPRTGRAVCRKHGLFECAKCMKKYEKKLLRFEKQRQKLLQKHQNWGGRGRGHGRSGNYDGY